MILSNLFSLRNTADYESILYCIKKQLIYLIQRSRKEKRLRKEIPLNKSNKWDAPRDVLLLCKRSQLTGEQARTTRTYRKRNTDYWSSEIIEERSKRR